jgi:hypothetical protein
VEGKEGQAWWGYRYCRAVIFKVVSLAIKRCSKTWHLIILIAVLLGAVDGTRAWI